MSSWSRSRVGWWGRRTDNWRSQRDNLITYLRVEYLLGMTWYFGLADSGRFYLTAERVKSARKDPGSNSAGLDMAVIHIVLFKFNPSLDKGRVMLVGSLP